MSGWLTFNIEDCVITFLGYSCYNLDIIELLRFCMTSYEQIIIC